MPPPARPPEAAIDLPPGVPERWQARLRFALGLARAAGMAIAPHFRVGSGLTVENKASGGFDPVTAADREAERVMRDMILAAGLGDGIDGEEFGVEASSNGWLWRLDPVDGTRAFMAGLPLWTTLISLEGADGVPVIGVIDQSFLGETYVGWPGGAALLQQRGWHKLAVRAPRRLVEAVAATTDPFIFTPSERGAFEHVRATARLTRYGCDAYAYARLAAGDIDLVIESGLQAHDVAALLPVVEGAGGVLADWRGRPKGREGRPLSGQVVACASQAMLAEAVISLRRSAV